MTASPDPLASLVFAAGVGQLLLAAGSVAIPRVLGWRGKLSSLDPLLRRLFWVYAAYILGTNTAFGIVSVLLPATLTDGSPLARSVCGFIALYWGARLAVQFALFHKAAPPGGWFRIAEAALTGLFLFLAVTYAAAAFAA
ncbi:MAG: hypothetical protein WD069_07645 [Planctomycetales bacterium]